MAAVLAPAPGLRPLASGPVAERMDPAPWLPPVLARARRARSGPTVPPAPAAPHVQPIEERPGAAPDPALRAGAAGALQAFAAAHATHLQVSADLHRRFLAQREHAAAWLLARGGDVQRGGPLPVAQPTGQPMAVPAELQTGPTMAPAPAPARPDPKVEPARRGPRLEREALEALARGERSISSIFGPAFVKQDSHRYQVRIPAPPLTITDRVLGFEGEPGGLGRAKAWVETAIGETTWGMDPVGRATTLFLGESVQVNMLLASYTGVDLVHDGHHRYRLLDLDFELVGPLPGVGDLLCTEVTLERQALVGGLRLLFFSSLATVNGAPRTRARFSAGMFTEEELGRPEQVRWDAAADTRSLEGPNEPPAARDAPSRYDRAAVRAFAQGRMADCFGPAFGRASTHARTPRIATEGLFFLDEVLAFERAGGPWGRGYLRATMALTPDDWFFAAHLPGDPCMPGFVLVEAGNQALGFCMTALGMTLPHDGWRFETVRDEPHLCKFRGQITPQTAQLVFEVFVESVTTTPQPRLVADVTCSLAGRTIFHARRAGQCLQPDWPLEQWQRLPYEPARLGSPGPLAPLAGLRGYSGPAGAVIDGPLTADYPSLLAFAWGRAENTMGPQVIDHDGTRRWARMPSPPFLFVTRVTEIASQWSQPKAGSWIETVYEIPPAAWYFGENGTPTMPFAVLLEAALQPSGWLMFYVAPKHTVLDQFVRNLDGTATFHEALGPSAGTLRIRTTLAMSMRLGGTVLSTMDIRGYLGERCVFEVNTSFGIFPADALAEQAGVKMTPAERERIASASPVCIDLRTRPAPYFEGPLRLAGTMLLMIDRVTALDRNGGAAGLGWARAEKDIDPAEWFFKAHFFQDPVQPGSLGLEGLLQLLQLMMIDRGLGEGVVQPRFEPIALGRKLTWKYRGQVFPENARTVMEVELGAIGRDERGVLAVAQGWLWVDGVRVYHAIDLGMRIVSGAPAAVAHG